MARAVATGPHKTDAARRMRATAQVLDSDHPETIAGDHLRDAARVLEHGSTEGAKRHLDAAMELLTPQNLRRHGILDDEGHVTAKHHMHQIHRHRLHVEDIEDIHQKNDQLRSVARALRGEHPSDDDVVNEARLAVELSARTAMLERTPAPRGRPGGPGLYHVKGLGHTNYLQQVVKALIEKRGMSSDKAYAIARARIRKWMVTSRHPEVKAAAGRAEAGELARQARAHAHAITGLDVADALIELACEPVDLVGPKGYVHGWIKVGTPEAAKHHMSYVVGKTGDREEYGLYNHDNGTVTPRHAGYGLRVTHIDPGEETSVRDIPAERARAFRTTASPAAREFRRRTKVSWASQNQPWSARRYGSPGLANEPGNVIDLFNPYHAPPGAGGGQFTTQQGAGQQQKQKQQKQAARKDRRGDRAQRQHLVREIAGIRSQIAALQAQLPAHHKSRSSTPAKKGAAATSARQAKAAKTAAASSKSAAKTARTSRMSPATIHAKIAALRATLRADLAELRTIK